MKLKKFFIAFVTLFGTMCRSKMMIKINEPKGFAELQEAALQILTTCYGNQNQTVALIGEFPGNFIRRLSSYRSFSPALLHTKRRAEKNINYWISHYDKHHWKKRYVNTKHKVHIFLIITPGSTPLRLMLKALRQSPYYNREALFLIIGWSAGNKYAGCDEQSQTYRLLSNALRDDLLNTKLLCRNREKGIVVYDANPFKNQAPEPWVSVKMNGRSKDNLHYFIREYRKHEGMCKNLDYDKTHDLGGKEMKTMEVCLRPPCSGPPRNKYGSRLIKIEAKRRFTFINNFFTYVNATRTYVWNNAVKNGPVTNDEQLLITRPVHLNGVRGDCAISYPHGQECKYLVSQFRGNMSQLEKIFSTIDKYSWIGMGMVYVITWMFFKYFLHQSPLVGILNIFRLTSNVGLTAVPVRVSSRIYLACLLFFVVTMQGIFVGNLASLLTHDIPARQVDTIKDLADLGYTVYAIPWDFAYFPDTVFKGRLIKLIHDEDCIHYIERDPLAACLTWSADQRVKASNSGLYISSDCFAIGYVINVIPWKWHLETTFDKYLKITLSADIMLELDALVDEKRFLEAESEKVPEVPEIMILSDLGFAFVFLGIGLGCSFICFIMEIIIHRRITRKRAIIPN